MSISMSEIDSFIDAAINRLSCGSGTDESMFYVDLHQYQQRITQRLVQECISRCQSRGLRAYHEGSGLSIVVNLKNCVLTPSQAQQYNVALNYTRSVHGSMF